MGLLDRLFGRRERYDNGYRSGHGPGAGPGYGSAPQRARTPDEQAIERYRYLLRTAPPE